MTAVDIASTPLSAVVDAYFDHDPALVADPYPMYSRLRTEAPAFRHADKLLVTRYDDVKALLVNPATLQGLSARGTRFRNAAQRLDAEHRRELGELFGFFEKRLGGANGERHGRLRRLAQKAFTPRMIATMEDRITTLADDLLAPFAAEDEIEVIDAFAFRLPLTVICEMLDISTDDREDLHAWATDLGQFVGANWASPEEVERGHECVFKLRSYLTDAFDSRRGGPTTDLLGALLAAEGEDGDRFTEDELVAMITQFVFAGHETTTNTIGNGLITLLRDHRTQWDELCDDAALIPGAVEEILRFESPTQNIEKMASEDGKIAGVPVHRYDSISVVIASANRDESAFEDPDHFDIHRAPNPHLTFGWGPHHCIGAALARLEVIVALRVLSGRFPNARIIDDEIEWRPNHMLRGPERLRVHIG